MSTTPHALKRQYKLLVLILVLISAFTINDPANSFASSAKSALVIDDLTGAVLLEKNETDRIPPASMSKLMTLYMIFDALRDKRILLADMIRVSKNASQKGGSKMFLNEGQKAHVFSGRLKFRMLVKDE